MTVTREEISSILRSHRCRRISFSFESVVRSTITVDGSTFTRVATAIDEGRIGVSDDTSGLSENTAAEYLRAPSRERPEMAPNTMYCSSPGGDRMLESYVVHESVHASFDIVYGYLPHIDNEVAAYIAGAFYLRNAHVPARAYRGAYDEVAMPIVDSIIRTGSASPEGLSTLRSAILSDSGYRSHGRCSRFDRERGLCEDRWPMYRGDGVPPAR